MVIRPVTTSLLLTAIQRDAVCVDKISSACRARLPRRAYLAFRHIFLTLRPGEDTARKRQPNGFAITAPDRTVDTRAWRNPGGGDHAVTTG